jgi:uncharacterized protein (DUF433 family)
MSWRERIAINPARHHGKPCIKSTRVPVIVGSVAEGNTPEEIIESWPQLTAEDIQAVSRFAAASAGLKSC